MLEIFPAPLGKIQAFPVWRVMEVAVLALVPSLSDLPHFHMCSASRPNKVKDENEK